MGILDGAQTAANGVLSAFDPLIDLGYGVYRSWLSAISTQTMTGSRTYVKLQGKPIGLVQQISVSADMEQQRILGIGDVVAQEIVPGAIEYNITGHRMMVPKYSLIAMGFLPDDDAWLTSAGLALEISDSVTGNSVLISGCKFTGYRFEAQKKRNCYGAFQYGRTTYVPRQLEKIGGSPQWITAT